MRKRLFPIIVLTGLFLCQDSVAAGRVNSLTFPRLEQDTITDQNRIDTLPELKVESRTVDHQGKVDSYLITKAMREDTRDAGDLLGKISGVHYNPLSKAVSYLGSANVKILVDSIEKDAEYIKRLNPDRFIKISVTNFPGGRYAGYDAVINLVTKPAYVGYDGTVLSDIQLRPGDRNGRNQAPYYWRELLEATYTRNNWNFAFTGSYNGLHDGTGRTYSKDFKLNGYSQEVVMPEMAKPNNISRRNVGNIALWTDYKFSDNHSLSLGLSAIPSSRRTNSSNMLYVYREGIFADSTLQNSEAKYSNSLILNLILQYQGRIKAWSLNAAGQFSDNAFDKLNTISRKDFSIDDNRHVHTQFVWGGVDAARGLLGSKLILSLSDYATWVRYRETDYQSGRLLTSSHNFMNQVMAGLQYSPSRQWGLGLDIGMNLIHLSSDGVNDTHVTPRLGFNAMWTSPKVTLRFNYTATSGYPSLAQQQDFGRFSDSLIYKSGNPDLSPSLTHRLNAMVTILRMLTISGEYSSTHNAIFDIAGIDNGMRPDGVEGPFVAYQFRNARSDYWKGNINFKKTFPEDMDIVSLCRSREKECPI